MGKSIKSGHYQKIIQKRLQMERLPRVMYLQKGHGWKGFQGQHFYRKVRDGKASKCDISRKGPRGQGGIGCPLTAVVSCQMGRFWN